MGLTLDQPDGHSQSQISSVGRFRVKPHKFCCDLQQVGLDDVGLTLEQPDGESQGAVVAPEVVRGRVVRATQLWQQQLSQQEACHQVSMPSLLCCTDCCKFYASCNFGISAYVQQHGNLACLLHVAVVDTSILGYASL